KGDTRYTNTTCFETFPFPQTATGEIVEKIRAKTVELHEYRTQQMESKQWGITTLYNKFYNEPSSKLSKLHEQLDKLVIEAYKFTTENDILEKLLKLNQQLQDKENQNQKVIGPEAVGDRP
ncbi:class I SAM-dependent DNA methyltransferase, partial [Anabaenopsis tanganyikae CS-531]|nr:class I SAM-dependent DNA methyltransferase [Anabaenopsis tanganyikae CS-531]